MYPRTTSAGFTLIEMIVSLALFASVSTVSIGALLVLIDNNRELRSEQSLITNLSYAMDMMTRDIRTGFDYYCDSVSPGQNNPFANVSGTRNCPNGNNEGENHYHGISFVEGRSLIADSDRRIAYYVDPGPPGGDGEPTIMRRAGSGEPQSIISSNIRLIDVDFIVTGASAGNTDNEQPTVTVLVSAETDDGTPFNVQTTVTQRFLDI